MYCNLCLCFKSLNFFIETNCKKIIVDIMVARLLVPPPNYDYVREFNR